MAREAESHRQKCRCRAVEEDKMSTAGLVILVVGFLAVLAVLAALNRIADTLWRIEGMLSRRLEPDEEDDEEKI